MADGAAGFDAKAQRREGRKEMGNGGARAVPAASVNLWIPAFAGMTGEEGGKMVNGEMAAADKAGKAGRW